MHECTCIKVTLEQLVDSLNVLSAGGDRIKVKTLYRAFTSLGSTNGTGMCMSKRRSYDETWRGMSDNEARVLIDSFNIPQQVHVCVTVCRCLAHTYLYICFVFP
jgi:hypothetical protein